MRAARSAHLPTTRDLIPGDAELLRRSARGDGAAFEAFVERHQAAVMRLLLATAANPADAEDALQETFLAAWRSARTFAGAGPARGWILTIARHALHRLYRRRVGEPPWHVPLDQLGLEAGWGADATPDAFLARLDDKEMLRAALAALPEDDREVLILRDLEELSGEETARALGITVQAMKSRLHRARLRLAARLKEGSREA